MVIQRCGMILVGFITIQCCGTDEIGGCCDAFTVSTREQMLLEQVIGSSASLSLVGQKAAVA